MTAPAATHTGILTVTVTIDRSSGQPVIPDPSPRKQLMVWYAYDRAHTPVVPSERPHELSLEVVGLERGETLEIHLVSTRHIQNSALAQQLLSQIFPTARMATYGFGWAIPFGSGPVSSGKAWSPAGNVNEFEIEYKARLYDRHGTKTAELDPDVKLIPDP